MKKQTNKYELIEYKKRISLFNLIKTIFRYMVVNIFMSFILVIPFLLIPQIHSFYKNHTSLFFFIMVNTLTIYLFAFNILVNLLNIFLKEPLLNYNLFYSIIKEYIEDLFITQKIKKTVVLKKITKNEKNNK